LCCELTATCSELLELSSLLVEIRYEYGVEKSSDGSLTLQV
jgi:hypothetical protein